jgi:hypothetical protein
MREIRKKNSVASTERPLLVSEVSANFADRGRHVVSVANPYGRILSSRPEPLLFLPSSSSVVLTRLSGPLSRPTTRDKEYIHNYV